MVIFQSMACSVTRVPPHTIALQRFSQKVILCIYISAGSRNGFHHRPGITYPSANNELVISDTKSMVLRADDQFLGLKGSLTSRFESKSHSFSSSVSSDDDALAAISCAK